MARVYGARTLMRWRSKPPMERPRRRFHAHALRQHLAGIGTPAAEQRTSDPRPRSVHLGENGCGQHARQSRYGRCGFRRAGPQRLRQPPAPDQLFRSLADPDTSKERADGMDGNQRKDEPVRRYPRAGTACGCDLGWHHGSPLNRVFGMEMEVVNKACYGIITQMAGVLHGWPPTRVTTLIGKRPIAVAETPALPSSLFLRELQAGNPKDIVMLLTSPVPGVVTRWMLGARRFPLVQECLRLSDVQMVPLTTQEDVPDGETR